MPVSEQEGTISGQNSAMEENLSSGSDEIERFGDESQEKRKKKKKKKNKKKRKEKKKKKKKKRGENDSSGSSPTEGSQEDNERKRDVGDDRWSERVQTTGRRSRTGKQKRSRSLENSARKNTNKNKPRLFENKFSLSGPSDEKDKKHLKTTSGKIESRSSGQNRKKEGERISKNNKSKSKKNFENQTGRKERERRNKFIVRPSASPKKFVLRPSPKKLSIDGPSTTKKKSSLKRRISPSPPQVLLPPSKRHSSLSPPPPTKKTKRTVEKVVKQKKEQSSASQHDLAFLKKLKKKMKKSKSRKKSKKKKRKKSKKIRSKNKTKGTLVANVSTDNNNSQSSSSSNVTNINSSSSSSDVKIDVKPTQHVQMKTKPLSPIIKRRSSPSPKNARNPPSTTKNKRSPSPKGRKKLWKPPSRTKKISSPSPEKMTKNKRSPSPEKRKKIWKPLSPTKNGRSASPKKRRKPPSPTKTRRSPSPKKSMKPSSPTKNGRSPSPKKRRNSPSPTKNRRSPSPKKRRKPPSPTKTRRSPSPKKKRKLPPSKIAKDQPLPITSFHDRSGHVSSKTNNPKSPQKFGILVQKGSPRHNDGQSHSMKRKHDNFVDGRAPKRRKISEDNSSRRKPPEPRLHGDYNSTYSSSHSNPDSADINYSHRPPPVTQSERSRRGPALIESVKRDRRSSPPPKQKHPSLYESMPIQDNSRIREKRNTNDKRRGRGREWQRSPPKKNNRDRDRGDSPQFQFRGPTRDDSPKKRRKSPPRQRSPAPSSRQQNRNRKMPAQRDRKQNNSDRNRENRGRSPPPSSKRNRGRRDKSPARSNRDRGTPPTKNLREKDRSPRRPRSRRKRSPSSSRSRSRGRRVRDRRKRRPSRSRSSSYSRRRSRRKSKKKKTKIPQWLSLAVGTFAMEHPPNPQTPDFNNAFCKLIVKQFPDLIKHAPYRPQIYQQLKMMYNEFYKCRFQTSTPLFYPNLAAAAATTTDAFSTLGLTNPAELLKQQPQLLLAAEGLSQKKRSRSRSRSSTTETPGDDRSSSESSSEETEMSAKEQKSEKLEAKTETKPLLEPPSDPNLKIKSEPVKKEIELSPSSYKQKNNNNNNNNEPLLDTTTTSSLTSNNSLTTEKIESMEIESSEKIKNTEEMPPLSLAKTTADARTQQLLKIVNSPQDTTNSNTTPNSTPSTSSYSNSSSAQKSVQKLSTKPPSMMSEESEISEVSVVEMKPLTIKQPSMKQKLKTKPPPSPAGVLIGKVESLLNRASQSKPKSSRTKPVARDLVEKSRPVDIVSYEKKAEDREKSQKRLLSKKKLMLFLDIDHTLLHASRNTNAKQFLNHPELRENIYEIEFENNHNCPYYVKLRPGVTKFLAAAAKKYNIVLYTMGFKKYAEEVRKLMDPTGHYIKAIISREDHNARRGEDGKKSIQEFIPLYDANTVIIDDIVKVWEKPENVLEVPRYAFWPDNDNDIKNYHEVADHRNLWTAEVLKKKENDNTLYNITQILNTVHEVWYATKTPKFSAPRIIDKLAQGVLAGCEIVFTGVIPVQRDPREHSWWKLAKRFGATCAKHVTDRTTHVIAGKRVTEKVQQARKNPGLSVVHINWLLQSCAQFVRADEMQFEFRKPPSPPPPLKCHAERKLDIVQVKRFSGLQKVLSEIRAEAADTTN